MLPPAGLAVLHAASISLNPLERSLVFCFIVLCVFRAGICDVKFICQKKKYQRRFLANGTSEKLSIRENYKINQVIIAVIQSYHYHPCPLTWPYCLCGPQKLWL